MAAHRGEDLDDVAAEPGPCLRDRRLDRRRRRRRGRARVGGRSWSISPARGRPPRGVRGARDARVGVRPAGARRCARSRPSSSLADAPAARPAWAPRRGRGSGWRSPRPYLGIGEGAATESRAGRSDRRPGDGRPPSRTCRACSSGSVASMPTFAPHGLVLAPRGGPLGRRRRDRRRSPRPGQAGRHAGRRDATDEALRIAGGPGFLAGRLERAFRDARAGSSTRRSRTSRWPGSRKAVLDRRAGRDRGRIATRGLGPGADGPRLPRSISAPGT